MARILCIDDEDDFREVLSDFLTEWGYEVIHAKDGANGLCAVLEYWPSLVICDRLMPVMNGLSLLRTLRMNYPMTAEIPFIFLTVVNQRASRGDVLEFLPTAYFTKPVNFSTLKTTVDTLVAKSA